MDDRSYSPGYQQPERDKGNGKLKPGVGKQARHEHDEARWTYTYEPIPLTQEDRKWVDKCYYLPIHRDEIHRNTNLIQIPGTAINRILIEKNRSASCIRRSRLLSPRIPLLSLIPGILLPVGVGVQHIGWNREDAPKLLTLSSRVNHVFEAPIIFEFAKPDQVIASP